MKLLFIYLFFFFGLGASNHPITVTSKVYEVDSIIVTGVGRENVNL